MDLINSIEPSLTTLLLFHVLPFLHFGFNAKYWYDPRKIERADFMLAAAAILLSAIVMIKMMKLWTGAERETIQLTLMHLAPLALTLLIINKAKRAAKSAPSGEPRAEAGYAPRPITKEIQSLSWDELIIDENLKIELISIVDLLKDPKTTKRYGFDVPKGILLSGPPGTGKTTIAKVIANDAQLNFFVLSMDEIVSKWVGDSEKNLTVLFQAAKRYAPSVIFIDEVDAIGRGRSGDGQAWAENLLNHLLTLVDGVVKTEGLYIIAATNRADLVDDALKRAGRLNKVIEIPLPDFDSRAQLFELYLAKLTLEENVDLNYMARITEGESGAAIKEICNQAGLNAFKRESGGKKRNYVVSHQDIAMALAEFVNPGAVPNQG